MEKLIHIFRIGKHTDVKGISVEFQESDLRDIANGYEPDVHESPVVVGHPKNDDPAFAWVDKIIAKGKDLYVSVKQVQEDFKKAVEEGRYKKISPAFYSPHHPSNPTPGKFYLKHVGFLGAKPPGVKGLQAVEFAENENHVLCFEESMSRLSEMRIQELETALLQREHLSFVDDHIRSGHILPKERGFVLAFMEGVNDDTLEFSDHDGEHSVSLIEGFKEFISKRPPVVHFEEFADEDDDELDIPSSEIAFDTPDGFSVDPHTASLHRQAVHLQNKHNISYSDAVKRVTEFSGYGKMAVSVTNDDEFNNEDSKLKRDDLFTQDSD